MKFQCGECDKFYKLDDKNVSEDGLSFKCEQCTNVFFLNGNLVFSSSNANSKLLCENCGQLLHESRKTCENCNLILNKSHEELRIDNRYYQRLEQDDKDNVHAPNQPPQKKGKKGMVALTGLLLLIFATSALYFFGGNFDMLGSTPLSSTKSVSKNKPMKIEKNVVIMKSGDTYYVEKIEKSGDNFDLTHLSGAKSTVKEDDVLSITRAIIEK